MIASLDRRRVRPQDDVVDDVPVQETATVIRGVPVDRRYLRGRHMETPKDAYRATREVLDDWRTLRLKTALGRTFRHTERIVIRRPWWMPARLYSWLLSTIVYEGPAE